MSDLYLVLRSRLASVPEWVFIETAILREARESRGLSYESMGRETNVSSKTWERYEKAGRVPRPLVPRVAEVLNLEIEEPGPRRVRLEPPEVRVEALDDLRTHVDGRFDELFSALTALDRKLDTMLIDEGRLRELEQRLDRVSTQLDQV